MYRSATCPEYRNSCHITQRIHIDDNSACILTELNAKRKTEMKNGKKIEKHNQNGKYGQKRSKKYATVSELKLGKLCIRLMLPDQIRNQTIAKIQMLKLKVAETQVREYRYRSNMTGILITIDKIQKIITYSNSKR